MKRKRSEAIANDTRLYINVASKLDQSKEMKWKRDRQDYHRQKFHSTQQYRKQTDVIDSFMDKDSYKDEYSLWELNDFDDTTRVEHFIQLSQQGSRYICNIDKTYDLKFKTNEEFDQYFNDDMIKSTQSKLKNQYNELSKDWRSNNNSRIFARIKNMFPNGLNVTEEYKDLDNHLETLIEEQKQKRKNKDQSRVQKGKIMQNKLNKIMTKNIIKIEDKIQMQVLYIRGLKHREIAKLFNRSINTITGTISRMRKSKVTTGWCPHIIERKHVTPQQIQDLFSQLDQQRGGDPMQIAVKSYLKSNHNLDVKKSYAQSLLRQGNFVRKLGNKCSSDEMFSSSKQRHFIFNIYTVALLRMNKFPFQEQDEFGVQVHKGTNKVIVRKGKVKDKFYKSISKKVNVAVTMGPEGILSWQFSQNGQVSHVFDYQQIQTLKLIQERNQGQKMVQQSCDQCGIHEQGPSLYQTNNIIDSTPTPKILCLHNSANFSKIGAIERLICLVKSRMQRKTQKGQDETKKCIDELFRSISADDVKGIIRRTVKDHMQYLKAIQERIHNRSINLN